MKKILLVDDEILIRESIRDCIPWEKEGFHLCGDAPDGEMALPLIEKHQPDILITDIKMPFMDGLELCRIVRQRMPEVKIIILSGHDEFTYAKTAIQLGVEEYCLKPVSSADLLALLHTISARIDQERIQKDRLLQMEEMVNGHLSLKLDKLMNDLCCGMLSTADALHEADAVGLKLSAPYYAAAITDIRPDNPAGNPVSPETVQQAQEFISAAIPDHHLVHVFRRSRTEAVWIVQGESILQVETLLSRVGSEVLPIVEEKAGGWIVLGRGKVHSRLQGIHVSYMEADEDKTFLLMIGINQRELQRNGGGWTQAVMLERGRLFHFLRTGTLQQCDEFITSFSAPLRQVDWRSSLYGYYLLNDLTLESIHAVHETLKEPDTLEQRLHRWQAQIRNVASYEQATTFLRRLAEELISLRNESAGKYAVIIDKVKEYIHQQYSRDDVTLQDAASHVGVSPSHLSKIFGQETGTTFIEYLTQTRIRHAKELLLTTNAKTYEIACMVGYNDAHYFSHLFKKTTGMTAKDFRKQGQDGRSAQESGAWPHVSAVSE